MTVVEVGDVQVADGAKFPGMIIEASREELHAMAGNILCKEVEVLPIEKLSGNPRSAGYLGDVLEGFSTRICEVDQRVRTANASRKYTRDEVLAMLDEIDPEGEKKGGGK